LNQELIVREDHGQVALLVMNRPDRRNALSLALVVELGDALTRLASEVAVRAVVLTGAGSSFCAGMDLKEAEIAGRSTEAETTAIADAQAIGDLIQQIHALEKPTVAALNGDAYAGGAAIALACDFVVAALGSKIGYPEVRRGLVAAMAMHDLVRQVGERRARALLLSGEPIDVAEAERWGLVNRVVAPELCRGKAIELAQSLLECGPRALATTKRLLDEASGLPKSLRGAAAVLAAVRVSDEAVEGIRAFLEKRPPLWPSERFMVDD
jgi:methylglutaconyl-CoA hydratase